MERAFQSVEWPTIFFFIGLFILVGGLVETGTIKLLAERTVNLTRITSYNVCYTKLLRDSSMNGKPYFKNFIKLMGSCSFADIPAAIKLALAPINEPLPPRHAPSERLHSYNFV